MLINSFVNGKSQFGKIVAFLLCLVMMLALLSLAPPKAHAATDRWVATTGSDTTGNGTSGAPYATITKAASVAVAGDTIKVRAGNYTGGFTTSASGNSTARIKYISIDGPGQATIRPGSTTYYWMNMGNYVDIEGFEFDGTLSGGGYSGVKDGLISQGSYVTIKGNDIHHIMYGPGQVCNGAGGSGINIHDFDVSGFMEGTVVTGNIVHDIGYDPACNKIQSIYISTKATVTNNVVYNNPGGAGIHLWHDAHNVTIANNTVVNHKIGIVVGATNGSANGYESCSLEGWGCLAANDKVFNNLLYGNTYGIDEEGNMGTDSYTYNLFYNNTTNFNPVTGSPNSLGTGNVTGANADPHFVDYANRNLKLQSNSAAIDKGTSTNAPAVDIEGLGRPAGSGYDIGAYEYNGNVGNPGPVNLALGKTFTGPNLESGAAAITDGVTNNSSYPTGYGSVNNNGATAGNNGPQYIQVDLGSNYNLGKIKIWHYYPDGRTYHDVIVQLSNDSTFASGVTNVFNTDTNNSLSQGTGTDAEYAETSAGKEITFSPVNARYVRLWTNGSSANNYGHYMEVEIYEGAVTNLAAGKTFTGGSPAVTNASYITDGIKNNNLQYASVQSGPQSIQVDLGASYNLGKINLWHYFNDGRTYHDVIVQLSNDSTFATGVTTVFNNDSDNSAGQGTGYDTEYAETSAGKSIIFSPVNARYVRLWTNGSTSNTWGHYMEVEVYASTATTNRAAGKTFTGTYLQSAGVAEITDGDTNSNNGYASVSNNNLPASPDPRWIQVDLGASYTLESVKIWHYWPDGRTYHGVIVQLSNDAAFASGVTTVFNNATTNDAGQGIGTDQEFVETSAGKSIGFSPANARYIRLWTQGSTVNNWGHYTEVQVFSQ